MRSCTQCRDGDSALQQNVDVPSNMYFNFSFSFRALRSEGLRSQHSITLAIGAMGVIERPPARAVAVGSLKDDYLRSLSSNDSDSDDQQVLH
jgi:hypothetical protein